MQEKGQATLQVVKMVAKVSVPIAGLRVPKLVYMSQGFRVRTRWSEVNPR